MTRKDVIVLLLLAALCAVVATASPQFLSVTNLRNIARYMLQDFSRVRLFIVALALGY